MGKKTVAARCSTLRFFCRQIFWKWTHFENLKFTLNLIRMWFFLKKSQILQRVWLQIIDFWMSDKICFRWEKAVNILFVGWVCGVWRRRRWFILYSTEAKGLYFYGIIIKKKIFVSIWIVVDFEKGHIWFGRRWRRSIVWIRFWRRRRSWWNRSSR